MASFTPQQIEEFLQEFFDVVGTRQYIGARYIPIFGRPGESSIEWDNTAPYEPLTIVTYQGNSYTSRTYVPAGIAITDQDYWALSSAYNAQVEAYRQEVVQLQNDWAEWKSDTFDDLDAWKDETVSDFEEAIGNVPNILPSSAFSPSRTVKTFIDEMKLSLRRGVLVVLGDSWSDEVNDPEISWVRRVSIALQMRAYFTNAKAGNGWDYGENNFPSQVSGALSKVTEGGYTANDVTLVIAFGGVNDYRHGVVYSAAANGIRTTFTNVRETFPNARVLFVVGNTGRWDVMDTLDTDDPNKATSYAKFGEWLANLQRNVQNGIPEVAAISCYDAPLWLNIYGSSADGAIWASDNLHPLQVGHNIVAQNIINVLNGIDTKPLFSWQGTIATPTGQTSITDIPMQVRQEVYGSIVTLAFNCAGHSASNLPNTLEWSINATTLPRICGGTDNYGYRIPVTAQNFSGNGLPVRGYYNAVTNRLILYPQSSSGVIDNLFGSVVYNLI